MKPIFWMTLVLAASPAWAESLKPADVKVVGALDYGQTSDPTDYTGSPRYVALVFNGSSRDKIEITVKGGGRPADVALADGTLKVLAHGSGHLAFTLPDKGSEPEAYYILFRDADGNPGRFTVDLTKVEVKTASLAGNNAACHII